MTATTEVRLYTEDFYKANEVHIDANSRCGNAGELVRIDNRVYMSIKATNYGTYRRAPDDLNDATVQADLVDLDNGEFESYELDVERYLGLNNVQLTAGDYYNTWKFIRFEDQYGYRWKIQLYRDNTNALSVSVLNADGSFWYTPGSFIEVEEGLWEIKSWVGEGNHEAPVPQYFEFIEGSAPITQMYSVPADVSEMDGKIAYYGDTQAATVDMSESEVYITTDNLGRRLSREEIEIILDDNGVVLTEDTRFFIEDSAVSVFYVHYTAAIDDYFYELLSRAK